MSNERDVRLTKAAKEMHAAYYAATHQLRDWKWADQRPWIHLAIRREARDRAVKLATIEACARAVAATFNPIHTCASENSDRYHIQDEAIEAAGRKLAILRADPDSITVPTETK